VDKIREMIAEIKKRIKDASLFKTNNTTCRQVSDRFAHLRSFSKKFDVIVFVGGKNSSNSKMLYEECKRNNPQSYFISNPEELKKEWFNDSVEKVGICGGTSTPFWLMENVAKTIPEL
jgi:4-hydroxy-3-methylbut-2-enyl diphosphate reductase